MSKKWIAAAFPLFVAASLLYGDHVKLVQWNICFLPGNFPGLYGGVDSAEERIQKVADKIEEINADLVLLQEAHDLDATMALAERIKETYPYIEQNIGAAPHPIMLLFGRAILNSGLFIASKKEISHLSFKPFSYEGRQWMINKGYCHFLYDNKLSVTVTHLQPGNSPLDREIRELELQEITDSIREHGLSMPELLTGDLNIPWGTEEYINSSIREYIDPYTLDLTSLTEESCTATNYLTLKRNDQKIEGELLELIDYCLLFPNDFIPEAATVAHSTFPTALDEIDFSSAISDHKAMITDIHWEQSENPLTPPVDI